MKSIQKLMVALLLVTVGTAQAQVSVNVSIGRAPAWGPAGYSQMRYYYMPDMEMYYDVNTANYIYLNNGGWVRTRALPVRYGNVNLYTTHKVVLTDYRGAAPYVYYKTHKVKYPRGHRHAYQRTIGVPPGHAKKMVVKSHYKPAKKGHKAHGHGRH